MRFNQVSEMFVKPVALPRWSIWFLGAINGLSVGLALEELRIAYISRQMETARKDFLKHHNWFVDFIQPQRQILVPLICIISFAVVAYLIHRYFRSRPRVVLLCWLLMGLVALLAGFYMSSFSPTVLSLVWILTIALVSYPVYRSWKNHVNSILLTWLVIGISAFFVLAFGVQIVGILFYWPEIRKPFTWLVCFGIVVMINSIYAVVLKVFFRQYSLTGAV